MIDASADSTPAFDAAAFDAQVSFSLGVARDLNTDEVILSRFRTRLESLGSQAFDRRLDAAVALVTDAQLPEALRFLGLQAAFSLDQPLQVIAIDLMSKPGLFAPGLRATAYRLAFMSDFEQVQELALNGLAADVELTDSQRRDGLRTARNSEFPRVREVAANRLFEFGR